MFTVIIFNVMGFMDLKTTYIIFFSLYFFICVVYNKKIAVQQLQYLQKHAQTALVTKTQSQIYVRERIR